MTVRIALVGNPNSGKTTLFNALTGSNQSVGNWPGVTVEKKEGRLQSADALVTDLPGVYSLSPYTPEELITRSYLMEERPDVILNIIDGTNLERNLYLTTQLLELGIPLVLAINMMDAVERRGDYIDVEKLGRMLGCEVTVMSAMKGEGVEEAAQKAIAIATQKKIAIPKTCFHGAVEHALAHIEERLLHDRPEQQQRFLAIKLFERDEKVIAMLGLTREDQEHIEYDIKLCELQQEDDAEAIIISARYDYVESVVDACCTRKLKKGISASARIDRLATHRIFAIPIFAAIMMLVYYVSVTLVGGWSAGLVNDGLFGDGIFLFGHGQAAYERAASDYELSLRKSSAFLDAAERAGIEVSAVRAGTASPEEEAAFLLHAAGVHAKASIYDEEGGLLYEGLVGADDYLNAKGLEEPVQADYGTFLPGLPIVLGDALEQMGTAPWLQGLVLDGMVAGVGSILGFVPQMLVLFFFLALLEACGYMARIAFILDQIFRRFGLSGKSFIPMLISTGCGVPGVMASRTIESPRDRRMTIMTTTFIPCGAKLPLIAMIAGAFFGGAWWVAPSAYFLGIAAVLISGAILKKTRRFAGEESPFVMELPLYHLPAMKNVLRSMWERGWSFIKKAGTVILIASVAIWFTSRFGFVDGSFVLLSEEALSESLLAKFGALLAWIFVPLGFGSWQASMATLLGLLAKEGVVSTMSVLYGVADGGYAVLQAAMTSGAAFSFMTFNLLCAPCFAAIGAIRQEMQSRSWFAFAIAYQTGFAYAVSLCIYQIWRMFHGGGVGIGIVAAILILAGFLFLLLRRTPTSKQPVQERTESLC